MKKLISMFLVWAIILWLSISSTFAADCLKLRFDNWDSVCLDITKKTSNSFRISVDESNLRKNSTVRCYIVLPNQNIHSLSECNGTFYYAWSNTQNVTVSATYVTQNNDFYSKRIWTKINFNNGTWWSSSSSSNNYNSDEIELSTNRESPSTNQYVNLTIETDRNYTGKLSLKAKYRSSSSSSWTSISNLTSSSYFSDYSNDWSRGYYRVTSSDRGEVTLKNLVKFEKKGYYRIYVEDTDGNESYIQFSVDTSSSSYNDELKVSASPSSPDTYEWVKLTITTDDDYTGKINFSKLQYKSTSSSSWSTISRTSSTYVSNYTTDWDNGYYKMKSSDRGEVTLKSLIKFRKSGYYRIYVEDTDGNESYVQIDVDTSSSSSSSNGEISLSTNRKSPSRNQYVNLTIDTRIRYTGKLSFRAKYRSSSSSSWTSISNLTSSSYFSDYSNDWSRGYYRMTSSDNGEVTLKNLVKFEKKGYYRIYVEDTDGNESYIQFSVWNTSSSSDDESSDVSGFSKTELENLKSVYKRWDSMIWETQRLYPSLKKNSYWINLSQNLKDDMKDVIDNKRYRDLEDYDDFDRAFNEWYEYTMRNV